MVLLYNLSIGIYTLLVRLASVFNVKANQWVDGRKNLLKRMENDLDAARKKIWFHFPSLGEFEQGRPVLEHTRKSHPDKQIVITFFSPSGYEVRKNYPLADHIFYLPIDSRRNAREFIRLVNPEIAVFTKYDFWYHYFNELKKRRIPFFVISAIFRKEQSFFQWYGGFQRKILSMITTLFVQDDESKQLLQGIQVDKVIVSGDTRFDRVAENAANPKELTEIQGFCSDSKIFIAGSTWPKDEKLIAQLLSSFPEWKFIIAPHEISETRIRSIESLFEGSCRYSELKRNAINASSKVLIIDNIGLLSSLYQYGNVAYIGGGFGVGIHNTLEAAVFNLPVVIGPAYGKFREARDLVNMEAAFSIKDGAELKAVMELLQDAQFRQTAGEKAGTYVNQHTGATKIILDTIGLT